MKIGNKIFNNDEIYIMGILNITPDSFFDGGKFNNEKSALKQAEKLINEGASIIDVGAESTRPNHTPISIEEEIFRLDSIVKKLKENFNIPISVDTTKAEVAEYVLNQGADLINDISNLNDANMAKIVAKFNSAYCLTYNVQKQIHSKNILSDLKLNFKEKVNELVHAGVAKDKIIFDPGIGFNKTFYENLLILKHIDKISNLNLPILVGTSNKSFIGKILNQKDANLRQIGTAATSAILAFSKVNFIRVHNVKLNLEAVKVASAIKCC